MDFEKYCEHFLAGKSGLELSFQIASDILNANGIITPQIPVFFGKIKANPNGKQFINSIRFIGNKDIILNSYPFEMLRTNKWGETVIAAPSVSVIDKVDAIDNTIVYFCISASIKEKRLLFTSSEMCISQSNLGILPDASEDEILQKLRERPIFDKIIVDYINLIELDNLTIKVNKENKKLEAISNKKESLEKEKKILENEIQTVIKQKNFLVQIGLIEDRNHYVQSSDTTIEPFSGTFPELIAHVKAHMAASSKHLIYNDNERIVERFICAMFTNQLIILSGEPGSGKTSLPIAIAKAINAKSHIISVQPNWTDNQDLLGFYNPIEKRYVSTPFLEALMSAQKDSEHIHFICLDEMNLAHIEYYFSSILSAMETEEKKVTLYVGQTIKELTNMICDKYYEDFSQLDESERKDWIEEQYRNPELADIVKLWKTAIEYPSEISIPSNVVFVGTLNMDETTKDISPKVLDRSYIIEINSYDTEKKETIAQLGNDQPKSIKPHDFIKLRKTDVYDVVNDGVVNLNHKSKQEAISNQIKYILKVWNDQKNIEGVDGLRKIQLSKRFLYQQLPSMKEAEEPFMSLSDILSGKILPLMQCDTMPIESRNEIEKAIEQMCGKQDYVTVKFRQMVDNDDSISFWWR